MLLRKGTNKLLLFFKMGLFDELNDMRKKMLSGDMNDILHESVNHESTEPNMIYTRGILQAIGFKEFHEYFVELEKQPSDADLVEKKRVEGINDMKTATRQYCRKQTTWIRNKLMPACLSEAKTGHSGFYLLDATRNIYFVAFLYFC